MAAFNFLCKEIQGKIVASAAVAAADLLADRRENVPV